MLVTSLSTQENLALNTVNIYRQRMRIEENFRDTKSQRDGFGLNESRTACVKRMNVLLLIGALATFICWLSGLYIENKGAAASYQAHSAKFKNVLSLVYLGKEAIKRGGCISKHNLRKILGKLTKMVHLVQMESIL